MRPGSAYLLSGIGSGATETAAILEMTWQRIQQMAAGGQLPHTRAGNALLFSRAAVEALVS